MFGLIVVEIVAMLKFLLNGAMNERSKYNGLFFSLSIKIRY